MPRRFRLPEGVMRRFLLSLGIVAPLLIYSAARAFPVSRPFIMRWEAGIVRGTTRMKQAVRFVLTQEGLEENALVQCMEDKNQLVKEIGEIRARDVGPLRTLPVQVVARAYGGDAERILVYREDQAAFQEGESIGIGKMLLARVTEAKGDIAVAQSVTHEESAIPAMIANKEDIMGVIQGTGGAWLEFLYVPKGSAIQAGDTVVTSGLGGGVIRGLTLGTVREVIDEDPSPFFRIKVEPILYSDTWWEADVLTLPTL